VHNKGCQISQELYNGHTFHSIQENLMLDQDQDQDQTTVLNEWYQAWLDAAEAKKIIEREQTLRKQTIALYFPEPKEGTNTLPLAAGWKLKATYKLERDLDIAVLTAIADKIRGAGINLDTIIDWKPRLKTTVYRELTEEQRLLFDQALIIRPSTSSLDLIPPKEKK
jgi:hypothetical protein